MTTATVETTPAATAPTATASETTILTPAPAATTTTTMAVAATEAAVGDALERAEATLAEANSAADELLRAEKAKKMRKQHHARRVVSSSRNPVPSGGIKRLARRGGVTRISHGAYGTCRETLGDFLRSVLKDAAIYTQCAKRNTIFVSDVLVALERSQGVKLYGYDEKSN